MKKTKPKTPYMPRVVVKMDTSTKTMSSKKDKASTRRALDKKTREDVACFLQSPDQEMA